MKNKHPFWTKLDWRGPRPLTLRELIMKSNFDTMMEIIIDFHSKMANQGGAFLKACYCIRDMKVKAHSEDYILAEYDSEYNEPYIGVLEGMNWHECLGYPVKWPPFAFGILLSTVLRQRSRKKKQNAILRGRNGNVATTRFTWPTICMTMNMSRRRLGVAGRGYRMRFWKGCSPQKKSSKSRESARKSWMKKTQAMMRQKRKRESNWSKKRP